MINYSYQILGLLLSIIRMEMIINLLPSYVS